MKLVKFCLFMATYDDHLAEMKQSAIYRRSEVLTMRVSSRGTREDRRCHGTQGAPTL